MAWPELNLDNPKAGGTGGFISAFLCGQAIGVALFAALPLFSVESFALPFLVFLVWYLWAGVVLPISLRILFPFLLVAAGALISFFGMPDVVALVAMVLLLWSRSFLPIGRWGAGTVYGLPAGIAAGLAACAAGLLGVVGVWPGLAGSTALAVAGQWIHSTWDLKGRTDLWEEVSFSPDFVLAAAVGAAGLALLRSYVPVARSPAYAAAALGVPFFVGALVSSAAWPGPPRRAAAVVTGALAVVGVCLLNALSFFGYPDLIVSFSGAAQTSSYELTAGRIFPFWVLALVLGVASGYPWRPQSGRALQVGFGGLGAVVAGWVARWYAAPYAVAILLAVAAGVVAFAADRRAGRRGSLVGRLGLLAAGAAALVCLLAIDPHAGWLGLRRSFGKVTGATGEDAERRPVGKPVDIRFRGLELTATLRHGSTDAEFVDGHLVRVEQQGEYRRTPSVGLAAALGLAAARGKRFGTPGPLRLATMAPFYILPVTGLDYRRNSQSDLIFCGPKLLSPFTYPRLLTVEGLSLLGEDQPDDAVLCLWLPVGTVKVGTLRRLLATVEAAWPRYHLFLEGRDGVVLAGEDLKLDYSRLHAMFQDPEVEGLLTEMGFWHPGDLLAAYVGDHSELKELIGDASPYRRDPPSRPTPTARDLSTPTRVASVAAVAQYRAKGPAGLIERVEFSSPAQKAVALRGFQAIYEQKTRALFRELGGGGPGSQARLVEFLRGPHARLDLLAPRREGKAAQMAAALEGFGLTKAARELLEESFQSGEDNFAWRMQMVELLAQAGQPKEAIRHCRRALELRADSLKARRRLAALLMAAGRLKESAGVLEQIVEQNPRSVLDLSMLAELYARAGRFERAAELARRVLRIEPGNASARMLLQLSGEGTREPVAPTPKQTQPGGPS